MITGCLKPADTSNMPGIVPPDIMKAVASRWQVGGKSVASRTDTDQNHRLNEHLGV